MKRQLIWLRAGLVPEHEVDDGSPTLYLAPEDFPEGTADQARYLCALWGAWLGQEQAEARRQDEDDRGWERWPEEDDQDDQIDLETAAYSRQEEWELALSAAGFDPISVTGIPADPLSVGAELSGTTGAPTTTSGARTSVRHLLEAHAAMKAAFQAPEAALSQNSPPLKADPRATRSGRALTLEAPVDELSLLTLIQALIDPDEQNLAGTLKVAAGQHETWRAAQAGQPEEIDPAKAAQTLWPLGQWITFWKPGQVEDAENPVWLRWTNTD